jgi:hypothetical protein
MTPLYFKWYNLCRVQRTLGATPAIQAGIADHISNLTELLVA